MTDTKNPPLNAARISTVLKERWPRYSATVSRGGYRVSVWNGTDEEVLPVKVEYLAARKDMGIGRFSEERINQHHRTVLAEMAEYLRSFGYNVDWGWDPETGDVDTTFLALTDTPRRAAPSSDPYALSRPLMDKVTKLLMDAKYLHVGDAPEAPDYGFVVNGAIEAPAYVWVEYRAGMGEDYSAILHTVRSYERVLSDAGLVVFVRNFVGHPVAYVTEDHETAMKVVEKLDNYEFEVKEADREEEENWAQGESVLAEQFETFVSLLVTLPQVDAAVQQIVHSLSAGDVEDARRSEHALYRAVLLAIVGGQEDPRLLAAAALKTQNLFFAR